MHGHIQSGHWWLATVTWPKADISSSQQRIEFPYPLGYIWAQELPPWDKSSSFFFFFQVVIVAPDLAADLIEGFHHHPSNVLRSSKLFLLSSWFWSTYLKLSYGIGIGFAKFFPASDFAPACSGYWWQCHKWPNCIISSLAVFQ